MQREWNQFLKELSINNNLIFNAIKSFKINKINDHQIEVSYASESAKTEFESVSIEFFANFKQKVNHFGIEIIYKYCPVKKTEIALSNRKIFENFVEINPVLKDLAEVMRFDFS
ncbi:MAG: hypothetical protein Q4A00_05345 [Flavobacteriaceae bacterium]|nr:hypothetical protein [Flavobacteriaceae bacterium]